MQPAAAVCDHRAMPRRSRAEVALLARRIGAAGVARALAARAWSSSEAFGLVADLASIPPARAAKIPIGMEPTDPGAFDGFGEEAGRVSGDDAVEVAQRIGLCRAGVATLYTADGPDGTPAYAQWLVTRDTQRELHEHLPNLFPDLGPSESLVEGAYTFVSHRGQGAMADGMRQLLERARAAGCDRTYTYVSIDNVPSLRGCARAGFEPDHLRVDRRRFGVRTVTRKPLDERALAAWRTAVS